MASKFSQIYPNIKDSFVQTFDDKGTRDLSLVYASPIGSADWNKIKGLNEKGAGVFFSVNSIDGKHRKKENVSHLNSWIVECDSLSKEEQQALVKNAKIKPSAIVESGNSYHIYYFAHNASNKNRETINRGLREYYNGDGSICSDTARVLRLPGFYHNKGEPFLVECIYLTDKYHTEDEMLKAFPYEEPIKETTKKEKPKIKTDNIRGVMSSQSNRYMLERISGSSLVGGESLDIEANSNGTDQIIVDGNSTGARIDKNDMIGSGSDGGPTWIQRAEWYGNSKSKILKWFVEFCDDLIPESIDRSVQTREIVKAEKIDKDKEIEQIRREKLETITTKEKSERSIIELMDTDPLKVMKWGREERDGLLGGIYGGHLYLIGADTGVGKSTFLNQVALNLSRTGIKVSKYSLEDRMEDIGKQELFYMTNRIRFSKKKEKINWIDFVNGEYTHNNGKFLEKDIMADLGEAYEILGRQDLIELDKKKEVNIDDVISVMEKDIEKGVRVFMIDHLHYFQYDDSREQRHAQIENAMMRLNEMARKNNVAIFIVAHYNAGESSGGKNINSFKGSSAIKQIANIIIQIERDDDVLVPETTFHLTKIRGPIRREHITATFDMGTFEYDFTKTKEQRQKESDNNFI